MTVLKPVGDLSVCPGTSRRRLGSPRVTLLHSSSLGLISFFLSRPHQEWGDQAESGQGDPASAQKWDLAHVHMIALRRQDYRKQGLAVGGMCPRGPGKVMGIVPERLWMKFRSHWSLLCCSLNVPPSPPSFHGPPAIWLEFLLVFFFFFK